MRRGGGAISVYSASLIVSEDVDVGLGTGVLTICLIRIRFVDDGLFALVIPWIERLFFELCVITILFRMTGERERDCWGSTVGEGDCVG